MTPWLLLLLSAAALAAGPRALPAAKVPALRALLVDSAKTSIYSPSGFGATAELIDSIAPSAHMSRLYSQAGFSALVEGDPARRAELVQDVLRHSDGVLGVKNAMYHSLVRVFAMDAPMAERWETAEQLSEAYASFFDGLAGDPSANARVQRQAKTAAVKLRDPKFIRTGLAYQQRLQAKADRLLGRVGPPGRRTPEEAAASWVVPKPYASEDLETGAEVRTANTESMAELEGHLDDAWYEFNRHLRRLSLAGDNTPRLVNRAVAEARRYVGRLRESYLPYYASSVGRFVDVTIGRSFLDDRLRWILGIPSHPGLTLVAKRYGWEIQARFATDIQDAAMRDFVKRSIEDYWQGSFFRPGSARLRHVLTRVDIEVVPPGAPFPDDRLRLTDATGVIPHGGATSMAVSRDPEYGDYGIPAHEFGHILGLSDDYSESYDADAMAARHTTLNGSLMGSRHGVVRDYHLARAVRLLRMRSLAPGDPISRWLWQRKRLRRWRAESAGG